MVGAAVAAVFWIVAALAERSVLGFSRPWVLNFGVGVCWFIALQRLDPTRVLGAAVTAHALSRSGAIGLTWASRPAASGFGLSLMVETPLALLAIALGLAASFVGGIRAGLLLIAASYLVLRLMQEWCYKRRGGIDAVAFSISQAALEILAMVVWAAL